jgi:TRAP-type C4-dicarboxylate transport system substrate-binding protein
MKKTIALILALAMTVLCLAGCGSTGTGTATPAATDTPTATDTSAAPAEQTVTLKIHCDYTEEHPTAKLLQEFCDRVNADTDGTLTIKPYFAGALGDYTTVFDEVVQGSIDMTFGCPSTTYGNVFNISNFPYLATSWDNAEEMFGEDSFLLTTMQNACSDIGVDLLAVQCVGAGCLATSKMPTDWETWGTDKGILIRVPNADYLSIPMKDMGYNIQGINWSELFTAVQTGVVDGFIGGHPPVVYDQFRDVVDYVIQLNNFFEVGYIAINADTFNSLSERQQEALQTEAKWAFEESCSRGYDTEQEYLQKLSDYGIEVIITDQAVLDNFATHCREEVWPQLKDVIGEDVYNELVANFS